MNWITQEKSPKNYQVHDHSKATSTIPFPLNSVLFKTNWICINETNKYRIHYTYGIESESLISFFSFFYSLYKNLSVFRIDLFLQRFIYILCYVLCFLLHSFFYSSYTTHILLNEFSTLYRWINCDKCRQKSIKPVTVLNPEHRYTLIIVNRKLCFIWKLLIRRHCSVCSVLHTQVHCILFILYI